MDFLFGVLTGIFAFVATLAIFVVHVLKVNLGKVSITDTYTHTPIHEHLNTYKCTYLFNKLFISFFVFFLKHLDF